jgi:hypothetical protein
MGFLQLSWSRAHRQRRYVRDAIHQRVECAAVIPGLRPRPAQELAQRAVALRAVQKRNVSRRALASRRGGRESCMDGWWVFRAQLSAGSLVSWCSQPRLRVFGPGRRLAVAGEMQTALLLPGGVGARAESGGPWHLEVPCQEADPRWAQRRTVADR